MTTRRPLATAAVALLCHAAAVSAQGPDTPTFSFDAFGTLGVVHSSENRADFVPSWLAARGPGHATDWSVDVDSRLGLQLTAHLTSRISAVGQVIVEQDHEGRFRPDVEWANIGFDITPDLSVRAGRMVLPAFLTSEYRKVGYATPWVRPPLEVYRLMPVTNTDGIDLSYRARFGGFTNTVQANFGSKDTKVAGAGKIVARDGLTLANTLVTGATTLYASFGTVRVTLDEVAPLFAGFRAFGPEGEAIADRYDMNGKRFRILSVGARHDPGDWFAMGEWGRVRSRTFVGDSIGWYVTGGYRIASFTPYLTLASTRLTSDTSDPGLTLAGLPPPIAAQAQGLNLALNDLLANGVTQKSVSAGGRWDFSRFAALKVQFDRVDLGEGSAGVLRNEQPGFRRGGNFSLFSATVDFVF